MKEKHEMIAKILQPLGFKDTQQYLVFTFNDIEFDFSATSENPELIMQTIINNCIHIGRQRQLKDTSNKLKEIFGFEI